MQQYLDLVKHVLNEGTRKENRTGVDTLSTFNYNYEHDLRNGFPLLTTKAISWKNIVVEMLWFLSGQTDISILKHHGCRFWDAWADPVTGKVPSAYGNFWTSFPVHGEPQFNNQIRWVLDEMRRNPMSRRMVVSAWAPGNAQTSKLSPCHCMFIFNVQNESARETNTFGHLWTDKPETKKRLCLHLTQRSCDVALGVPYNIASYSLLLHLFAQMSGLEPGVFAHTLVDAHVYTSKPDQSMVEYDHMPGLIQQLLRDPRPLPQLKIDPTIRDLKDIEELMHPKLTTDEVMSHFVLENYNPHPAIQFKVAV